MTQHKSFERLVRGRNAESGEIHAAAAGARGEQPALATSDAAIRQRTGRGWQEWFDLLDEWGAADRPHREIARWVADRLGIEPLAWSAQAIAASYERARGGRAVGQRSDGFAVTVSKTVAAPVDAVFDAFLAAAAEAQLRERTATRPKSARFDFGDDGSRVHVTFLPRGDARSTLSISHERLAAAEDVERMRGFWRERAGALKEQVER